MAPQSVKGALHPSEVASDNSSRQAGIAVQPVCQKKAPGRK